jgi:hypothetical protein
MKINTDRNEVEKSAYIIILHLFPLIVSPIVSYFLSKYYVLDIDIAINISLVLSYGTFAIIALSPIVYFQMLGLSTTFYNKITEISGLLSKEREYLDESETAFTNIMDNLKGHINDELATPSIKKMLEDQVKACSEQIEIINNRKTMHANMSSDKLVESLDMLLIKVYGSFKFLFLKAVIISCLTIAYFGRDKICFIYNNILWVSLFFIKFRFMAML